MERIKAGRVTLFKWICEKCGEENLTGEDSTQCIGCRTLFKFDKKKSTFRVIAARDKRKTFGKAFRASLAEEQDGLCFWCGNVFGDYIVKQGVLRRLEIIVEHVNPVSYSFDNGKDNLVASCQVCNGWKGAKVFTSNDECRGYLMRKWASWEQRKLIVHVKEIEDKTRVIYDRITSCWHSCITRSTGKMFRMFRRFTKRS